MANNKFFIAKNGILTPVRGVFGSSTDNGTDALQVTGSSLLTGGVEITGLVDLTNTTSSLTTGSQQAVTISGGLDVDGSAHFNSVGHNVIFNADTSLRDILDFRQSGNGKWLVQLYANSDLNFESSNTDYTLRWQGNEILTDASIIDADTLDGLDSTQFVRSDVDDIMDANYQITGNLTVQNDVLINGDLVVQGNVTSINTTELTVSDNIIVLNNDYIGSAPTLDAGLEINRGFLSNAFLLWDETNDYWKLIDGTGTDLGRIITTADEGPGNGFDADTVDGLEGYQFLRSDVADIANGHITFLDNITIGDNVADSVINFATNNFNVTKLASSGLDIGFLDQLGNYASYQDANYDWNVDYGSLVTNFNVDAQGNIVSATGNIQALTGYISANQQITAGGYITAGTYITAGGNITGEDIIARDDVIAWNQVTANNNITSLNGDIISGNDINANNNITTTNGYITSGSYITAGTNITAGQNITAGWTLSANNLVTTLDADIGGNITATNGEFFGSLTVNNNITTTLGDITAGNYVYGKRFVDTDNNTYFVDPASDSQLNTIDIDDYIRHRGDLDTYLGFPNNGQITFYTDNVQRALIQNTRIDFSVDVYAPRYYDSDNVLFYADPASTSRLNTVAIVSQIEKDSDTNTNIQFPGTDQIEFNTGGNQRLLITNSYVLATNEMQSPLYRDSIDNTYYWDPNTDSAHRFYTPSGYLTIGPRNTSYSHFLTDRPAYYFDKLVSFDGSIRGHGGDETATFNQFIDSANSYFYGDFDSTSVINDISLVGIIQSDGDVGTYLDFNGVDSFQINTGNSARVTVTNTAVTVTPDLYAPRMIDTDNNTYLVNPSGDSVMNQIQIDDYIRHINNLNSFFGFQNDNVIVFNTGATSGIRLQIEENQVTVNEDFYAPNLYDLDNPAFFLDPASTGTSLNIAGDIVAGGITLEGGTGDGTFAGAVTANNVIALTAMYSPIYYDSDNVLFYGDFAGRSYFNTLSLNVNAGATATDSTVDISGPLSLRGASPLYFGVSSTTINSWKGRIYNRTGTTLALDAQTFEFGNVGYTSGAIGMTFTPSTQALDVYGSVTSPIYYDRNDTNYYIDLANTAVSVLAAGSGRFGIITDGNRKDDTTGDGGIAINVDGYDGAGANAGVQISGVGGDPFSSEPEVIPLLSLNRLGTQQFNPYGGETTFLDFRHNGVLKANFALAPDLITAGADNLYLILQDATSAAAGGNNFQIWNSAFAALLNLKHDGELIIGNFQSTYTASDNAAIVGTIADNKVHIETGSIQLNDNDGAIVFGAGTATFLKQDELGFGQGGGFYMDEATTVKIRNDAHLYTAGVITGSIFYDADDINYYANPAGDSQFNTLDIDDYVRHRGDLNTYFGFPFADTIVFATNGVQRLQVANTAVTSTVDVYGPKFIDTDNNSYYLDPNSLSELHSANFYSGATTNTVNIGRNANERINLYVTDGQGYFRYYQDEAAPALTTHAFNFDIISPTAGTIEFRFQKNVRVNADLVVSAGNNAYSPIYYDTDDDSFYGDFASTSRVNNIALDGILHKDGDAATYINFPAASSNTVSIYTGGAQRVNINDSRMIVYHQIRSPIYYDYTNTNWYADPAGQSRLNTISLDTNGVILRKSSGEYGSFEVSGGSVGITGYEGLGIAGDVHFLYDGTSETGLMNDVNNQWIWRADFDSKLQLYYQGSPEAETANGYFLAINEMHAPIYYDSDNTDFYGNFSATSRMNTIQANRIYPAYDNNTAIYIDYPTGDYGSIQVNGGGKGGWEGYSINGRYVWMSPDNARNGIYNDLDNQWMTQWWRTATDNGNIGMSLYADGVAEAHVKIGWFEAVNSVRAPVFYDTATQVNFLDLGETNTNVGLKISSQIQRLGFTQSGDGNDNKLLVAQDYSHWIWNTATDWGIFWAGNNNPYRSYFSTGNPNEIVFIGDGVLKASIDLDNGNAFFAGQVYADNFNIVGPAGNISLNPAYGSGGADLVLLDLTQYFEAKITGPVQSNEVNNFLEAEYTKVSDGPFAGSNVIQSSAFKQYYSDFIPVAPGEEIYGEVTMRYISGSGGNCYFGVCQYDKDKNPITSNLGIQYFVLSGQILTDTAWTTYRGHWTIPTTHTPYNGSDGGGVRWVRLIFYSNYNTGGSLRQFGGIMLKRRNAESHLTVDDLYAIDDITAGGDITGDTIYGNIFRDRDTNSYYVDPGNTGTSINVRGTIKIDGGDDDTWLDLNSASAGYGRIKAWAYRGDPVIEFSDWTDGAAGGDQAWAVGADDRDVGSFVIRFRSTPFPSNWTSQGTELFQLKNNGQLSLGYNIDASGDPGYKLNVAGIGFSDTAFRAPKFIDDDDDTYYVDPATDSVLKNVLIHNDGLRLDRSKAHNGIWFNGAGTQDFNHVLWNDYYGGPGGRGAANSGFDGIKWNVYRGIHIRGGSAGANDIIIAENTGGNTNTHTVKIYAHDTLAFQTAYGAIPGTSTNVGYVNIPSFIQSPTYYDSQNTGFYGNFAGTSRFHSFELRPDIITGGNAGRAVIGGNFGNNAYNSVASTRLFFGGGNGDAEANYFIGTEKENYNGDYTKLDLRWHTGIRMGAQAVYGGTRIYDSEDLGTLRFSVGRRQTRNNYIGGTGAAFTENAGTVVESGNFYAPNLIDTDNNAYYLNPSNRSNLNLLNVGGWEQNNPITGFWKNVATYSYTGVYYYYWYRIGRVTASSGARVVIEYYAHDDANYPFATSGRITVSSYGGYSLSVQHENTGVDGDQSYFENSSGLSTARQGGFGAEARVVVDSNRYVWLQLWGNTWSSRLYWHNIYAVGYTPEQDDATLVSTRLASPNNYNYQPPNSSPIIKTGYQVRLRQSNIGSPYQGPYPSLVRLGQIRSRTEISSYTFQGLNSQDGSRNASYQVTPVNTSYLNRLDANDIRLRAGNSIKFYTNNNTTIRGYIEATEGPVGTPIETQLKPGGQENLYGLVISTSGGEEISFRDGGRGGDENLLITGGDGYAYFRSYVYATRFVDRDSTSYYVDPASTSRINSMRFNLLRGNTSSTYDKVRLYDSNQWAIGMVNDVTYGDLNDWAMTFRMPNVNERGWWWGDVGHSGTSGQGAMALSTRGNLTIANAIRVGFGTSDTTTPTRTLDVDGDAYFQEDVYARRYYDIDDINYYVDPRSESILRDATWYGVPKFRARGRTDSANSYGYVAGNTRLRHYLSNVGAEFWGGNPGEDRPITIYFRSGPNAPSDFGYITWDPDYNNSGENAALVIGVENDGTGTVEDFIRLQGRTVVDSNLFSSDNTTMMQWLYQGNEQAYLNTSRFRHGGEVEASIFYDTDRNYFLNPDGTSQLRTVKANIDFYAQGSAGYLFEGTEATRGIWNPQQSGSAYGNVATYGNGRGGWHGYAIGDRWVMMSQLGAQFGVHDNTQGWLWYWDGTTHVYNYGDMRTLNDWYLNKIWKVNSDGTKNTNWYIDPSGETQIYYLSRYSRAQNGLTANPYDRLSGHSYYSRRPNIYGNPANSPERYWVGTWGWGWRDHTELTNWGSVPWDSWGNGVGNRPRRAGSGNQDFYYKYSDYSHFQGINVLHRVDGTNTGTYGWQLASSIWSEMGDRGGLHFRKAAGTWRQWYTAVMYDNRHTDITTGDNYLLGNNTYVNSNSIYTSYIRDNYTGSSGTEWYLYPRGQSRINRLQVLYGILPGNITGPETNGLQQYTSDYSYRCIFESNTSGFLQGWQYPEYKDLVLNYHTGITFGALGLYGGVKFKKDVSTSSLYLQIGGPTRNNHEHITVYEPLVIQRNKGLTITDTPSRGVTEWSGTPPQQGISAELIFNHNVSNYGTMMLKGSKYGWVGITHHTPYGTYGGGNNGYRNPTWMYYYTHGNGGLYYQTGRWATYYNYSNSCWGWGWSATASAYQMYVRGSIYATGNIVAYSDARSKKNIVTIDNALEKVLQLRGVYYNLKDIEAHIQPDDSEETKERTRQDNLKRKVGVIAQEVLEVLPEVVTYAEDVDTYGVDYSKMAGLFIEAIKDQQQIINSQQEKIDKLEEMVYNLMEKLNNGTN